MIKHLKNHFLLKFKVNKFSKFQNKISISIFYSYANQIIQLENYVENIIYSRMIKYDIGV